MKYITGIFNAEIPKIAGKRYIHFINIRGI